MNKSLIKIGSALVLLLLVAATTFVICKIPSNPLPSYKINDIYLITPGERIPVQKMYIDKMGDLFKNAQRMLAPDKMPTFTNLNKIEVFSEKAKYQIHICTYEKDKWCFIVEGDSYYYIPWNNETSVLNELISKIHGQ